MVLAKARRQSCGRWVLLIGLSMETIQRNAQAFTDIANQDDATVSDKVKVLDLSTLVEIRDSDELQNLDLHMLYGFGMIAFTEWAYSVKDQKPCFRQTDLVTTPEGNYVK